MRKTILITTASLFTILNCFSQKSHNENIMSFSIGPSLPIGSFGKKDINNNLAGFARVGEQINISFKHKLNNAFGISAMLHGQRNAISTSSLQEQFSEKKFNQGFYFISDPNQPPPSPQYIIYPNWNFDKKSWFCASFLVGPSTDISFNKTRNNLFLTAKAMIGVIYVLPPKLNGRSLTDTASAQIMQKTPSAFGFSFLLSSGVKYNLTKETCVLIDIGYLATNQIKFKDSRESFGAVKNANSLYYSAFSSSTSTTAKQNIATININFGIGFRL